MKNSIAEEVIEVLTARRGFDHWWDEIDDDSQHRIVADLNYTIGEAIKAHLDTVL